MMLQSVRDRPNGAKIAPLNFASTINDTYKVNRPAIRRIEIDGCGNACHQCYRLLERFDCGVWQGNAIADGGCAQLFPANEC